MFCPLQAFFSIVCAQKSRWFTHYIYSVCIYLLITRRTAFLFEPCSSKGTADPQGFRWWSSSKFHRESTLRFIPKGYEVSMVLIHLLSRILQRHESWLYILFIATTVMSARVCPSPLKCSATGDSSVFLCVMLYRWPLILRPHILGHTSWYTWYKVMMNGMAEVSLISWETSWMDLGNPVVSWCSQVVFVYAPIYVFLLVTNLEKLNTRALESHFTSLNHFWAVLSNIHLSPCHYSVALQGISKHL